MNLPYFISKRITDQKTGSFSSTISRIAVVSIAVGLAAMILAFFILGGFQNTIKEKIYNFKGHLEITKYTLSSSFDDQAISLNSDFYQHHNQYSFVTHVQEFAHKAALLKTDEEVQGVIFKGYGRTFDTTKFRTSVKEGRFFSFNDSTYSKEVIISSKIAKTLKLKTDDDVLIYFVQNPPRFRKLKITGIYETGLEEFDQRMVIGDIGLVQRMNNWSDTLVGGYEVFVDNPTRLDDAENKLFRIIGAELYVDKVSDKYIQIFDWLGLLDQNVSIFLSLILVVAAFNMISILLILIMERTYMIGVFLAIGATTRLIKRVFLYNGMILVGKGLFWGNIMAILIAFIQDKFKLIPLDPENYYMYYVPVSWDFSSLISLNIITFILVTLALFIPILIISRIRPIAAIRFD